jgi:hypothetical protein
LIPAPSGFPPGLNDGLILGFHGLFDASGVENPTNPVLYIAIETLDRVELVSNDSPGVGHINSLAAADGVLYAADLCHGSFLIAAPCGAIWRIS